MVADPLDQGKVTKNPGSLVLESPAEASFLRVQPLRTSARAVPQVQMSLEGRLGETLRGRSSETQAFGSLLKHISLSFIDQEAHFP